MVMGSPPAGMIGFGEETLLMGEEFYRKPGLPARQIAWG
jgi:hypothetical protein